VWSGTNFRSLTTHEDWVNNSLTFEFTASNFTTLRNKTSVPLSESVHAPEHRKRGFGSQICSPYSALICFDASIDGKITNASCTHIVGSQVMVMEHSFLRLTKKTTPDFTQRGDKVSAQWRWAGRTRKGKRCATGLRTAGRAETT
jgi:hypothetical protein